MKIDCPHWYDLGLRDAGQCALGKFRGRPSLGTCMVCLGITPTLPVASRPLPAILTDEQRRCVQIHRAVCENCKNAKGFTQVTVKCEGCGCAGVSLLNRRCPKGKWITADSTHDGGQADLEQEITPPHRGNFEDFLIKNSRFQS